MFWGLAYAALIHLLDSKTLRQLFFFGALSIPVMFLIKACATILLQKLSPVSAERLYEQSLKTNTAIKVLFVISFYHSVAKQSSKPILTLVAAAVLFTLAIPEHMFRFWTYKEAPDRYNLFILHHSSLLHRLVIVGLALLFQILWMKFE